MVAWGTIQQLWMLFLRLWRWWTTQDYYTELTWYSQVLLTRFVSLANSTTLWSTLLYLALLSMFLQPTLESSGYCILLSHFTQEMFLVDSTSLWLSSNLKSISSWIRLSHIHLFGFPITQSEVMYNVCTTYHNTTNHSSLHNFSHMIYIPQTNMKQNIAKLSTHSSIHV